MDQVHVLFDQRQEQLTKVIWRPHAHRTIVPRLEYELCALLQDAFEDSLVVVLEDPQKLPEQLAVVVIHHKRVFDAQGIHHELIDTLRGLDQKNSLVAYCLLQKGNITDVCVVRAGQEKSDSV